LQVSPTGSLFTGFGGQPHLKEHAEVIDPHCKTREPNAVVVRSSVPMEARSLSESTSAIGAATDTWEKRSSAPRAAEQRTDFMVDPES